MLTRVPCDGRLLPTYARVFRPRQTALGIFTRHGAVCRASPSRTRQETGHGWIAGAAILVPLLRSACETQFAWSRANRFCACVLARYNGVSEQTSPSSHLEYVQLS